MSNCYVVLCYVFVLYYCQKIIFHMWHDTFCIRIERRDVCVSSTVQVAKHIFDFMISQNMRNCKLKNWKCENGKIRKKYEKFKKNGKNWKISSSSYNPNIFFGLLINYLMKMVKFSDSAVHVLCKNAFSQNFPLVVEWENESMIFFPLLPETFWLVFPPACNTCSRIGWLLMVVSHVGGSGSVDRVAFWCWWLELAVFSHFLTLFQANLQYTECSCVCCMLDVWLCRVIITSYWL